MKRRVTHDADDTVLACPECDRAGHIYHRIGDNRQGDAACRCHDCGACFERGDIVERDAKANADNPQPYTDDGLPRGLTGDMKQQIRAKRAADQ